MSTPLARIVARVRDGFSSTVLGTTSTVSPLLTGGLSLASRIAISAGSLALASALAFAFRSTGGALALLFLFPALMIGGIFGGVAITSVMVAIAVSLSAAFFTSGLQTVFFALAAVLQAVIAVLSRGLFRESRRWGVRYRTLIDAVTAGVVVSDPTGQILWRQPDFERAIGMQWPDYAGMGWLAAVHPDDLKVAPGEPGVANNVLRRTVRLRDASTNDWRWFQFRSVALAGQDGRPQELISVLFDVHRQRMVQEERDIAAGEMHHRWKNLMTVITALATSSQPAGDKAIAEYVKTFLGRLHALSAAGDEAITSNRAIDIGGVIRATLAPFVEQGAPRVAIDGPPCPLTEQTGAALALGIHELATNAIKHGALSIPSGSVRVFWTALPIAEGARVTIEWTEKDGPPVRKPERVSYGTRVIRFIAARERDGHVEIDYRPEGLHCRITFVRDRIAAPKA